MYTIIHEVKLLQPMTSHFAARDDRVAAHGTGQQDQQWCIRQLIDSYINIILPSHIPVILFNRRRANACNKITETAVDGMFSVIVFCFILFYCKLVSSFTDMCAALAKRG